MQSSILYSTLIAIITIGGLIYRYRSALDFSISLNAVKHPLSLIWLATGTGLSLLFAGLWYLHWFAPEYGASLFSATIFTGVILSLLVLMIVPDIKGIMRTIHRSAGYLSVILMPLFLISIFEHLDFTEKVIAGTAVAAQIVMIYLLFFVKQALKYLLQFQALYLLSFFIVLIFLTYA